MKPKFVYDYKTRRYVSPGYTREEIREVVLNAAALVVIFGGFFALMLLVG